MSSIRTRNYITSRKITRKHCRNTIENAVFSTNVIANSLTLALCFRQGGVRVGSVSAITCLMGRAYSTRLLVNSMN